MKQFLTLTLIAGALMVTSPSQAGMVASKSQCLASCGSAISTSCGWITKPGRFNRCRTRLINQCRKFGMDVMCPPPPPPSPPAPVVTTTTATTLPYVPPTTTTLPPPPPPVYGPWTGTWNFYGSRISDTCPPSAALNLVDTFYVVQNGTSFTAPEASLGVTFTGTMDSDGGFTIEGSDLTDVGTPTGCVFTWELVVSPVGGVMYSSDPATYARLTDCPGPGLTCTTVWSGTVSY
jgi:hypothetical protein